jgi:hypothetical protein
MGYKNFHYRYALHSLYSIVWTNLLLTTTIIFNYTFLALTVLVDTNDDNNDPKITYILIFGEKDKL